MKEKSFFSQLVKTIFETKYQIVKSYDIHSKSFCIQDPVYQ